MDKQVKIRVDEMLAAIKAAPHLKRMPLYAVNACRQSLANDLQVDEEIVNDLIEVYGLDDWEISKFFQEAQHVLTIYQIYQDEYEYSTNFDKLNEQVDFGNPVMALAKCLILATIDDHHSQEQESDDIV